MKTKSKINNLLPNLDKPFHKEPEFGAIPVCVQEIIFDKQNVKTGHISEYPIIMQIILN